MPLRTAIPPERDEADKARHGERLLGEHQSDHTADKGRRNGVENLQCDAHRRIEHHQHDENAGQRNNGQAGNEQCRRALRFELSAEFQKVSFRKFDAGFQVLLDLFDGARQIASGDVAADDLLSAYVFAIDEIGAAGRLWKIGHVLQANLSAAVRQVEPQLLQIEWIGAVGVL